MNPLAENASAAIKINNAGYYCRICSRAIPLYGLMIAGTSRFPTTVYFGGYFDPTCWFLFNFHSHNLEVYEMAKNEYDNANIPNLKPIGPMLEELRRWDTTHKHLINVEIIILAYEPIETQYGKQLLAHCIVGDEKQAVLIGGEVLQQQLRAVKDNLPVSATIIKTGTYYTFK